MNLKNAHPFTESAERTVVHSHHGVLWVLALHTQDRLLPKGLMIQEVVPTSVKVLVGLCLKNQAREVYLQSKCHLLAPLHAGPILKSRAFLYIGNSSHQLVVRLFQLYRMPSQLLQKGCLLRAFPLQTRWAAFVLIRSLYSRAFQLLPCRDLGDTTFQFVSNIVHFSVHFVYVINYAYYIK